MKALFLKVLGRLFHSLGPETRSGHSAIHVLVLGTYNGCCCLVFRAPIALVVGREKSQLGTFLVIITKIFSANDEYTLCFISV